MSSILKTPLPSTGMNRHFWITVDKATPARNTFQCVLIIAVYNGEKCVFPVGVPLVYRPPPSGEQAEHSDERERAAQLGCHSLSCW